MVSLTENDKQQLLLSISHDRFGRYLNAAAHDLDFALSLYLWNAELGASFFTPLQAVEVALRNSISRAFTDVYGENWWENQDFLSVVGNRGQAGIDEAKARLSQNGKPHETGRVIAELTFGFWQNALAGRFNPAVWSSVLHDTFPALPPGMRRADLYERVRDMARLRNRIFHHEPLFNIDTSLKYHHCTELLGWVAPEKLIWLRPSFQVPVVLRRRPKKAQAKV